MADMVKMQNIPEKLLHWRRSHQPVILVEAAMLNTTDSIGFRPWGQGISVKRDDTVRTHVKDRGIKHRADSLVG